MRLTILLVWMLAFVAGIHAQDNDVILGYCDEPEAGYGEAGASVTPWITFGADKLAPYAGCRITKVRLGLKAKASNVTVYFRTDRNDNTSLYSQKAGKLEAGWQTVELETPFEIKDGEPLSIGYKASFGKAGGAGYTSGRVEDACHVYCNTTSAWADVNGAFCIQAVVEGEGDPINEMEIRSLADGVMPFGASETLLKAKFVNLGANRVDNFSYCLAVDGNIVSETAVDSPIEINGLLDIDIPVPSAGIGKHDVTVTILKVNGVDDRFTANNSASATVTERDPSFMKRVVVEEATGTWCGWCPRGIVGLEMMAEKYPDQFIGIAVHGNDVMSTDDYEPFLATIPTFPNCKANRHGLGDPYNDIERMILAEMNQECHVGYSMNVVADGNQVTTHSYVIVDQPTKASALNFAFAVVEDKVCVPGDGRYSQKNSFSGGSEEMAGWENLPGTVVDYVFNDVARGIFSSYEGEPLLESDLNTGDKAELIYSFTLPETIINVKNVSIVGMVIDASNGFILNAFKCPLNGESGLNGANADRQPVSTVYYALDGTRLASIDGHQGVCIRVTCYSDGSRSVRKVIK